MTTNAQPRERDQRSEGYEANQEDRGTSSRVPFVRLAGAALAIGGLSASVATAGAARGAANGVVSTTRNAHFGTILVSGNAVY